MRTTVTLIKADVGSIGGHIQPSAALLEGVATFVKTEGLDLLSDFQVSFTGDDIAILMVHQHGQSYADVHRLAFEAFKFGTTIARQQGLYGAGQDLLSDAFSGNVKGLGPAVAELEFEERPNEPFLVFAADKTDPGAYNLAFYLGFADPMYSSGLTLVPAMQHGFRFRIMDVSYTQGDRVIELDAPEDLYRIAMLLRDPERYVIEGIFSRKSGDQAVSISTTRLHNIAGRYTGKDDPVALVRVQSAFPATGEILAPFAVTPLVAGFMRGSHVGPLVPVKRNTPVSYFDGPPQVSCTAYCVHDGKLTEPVDAFDHPFWDHVRTKAAERALWIRSQGFFGAAMLPIQELEYGGITEALASIEDRFHVREAAAKQEVPVT